MSLSLQPSMQAPSPALVCQAQQPMLASLRSSVIQEHATVSPDLTAPTPLRTHAMSILPALSSKEQLVPLKRTSPQCSVGFPPHLALRPSYVPLLAHLIKGFLDITRTSKAIQS
ncbi:hypothetical protein FOMG_16853 [Fusarium oxysporum f. sp. melonis 26406]|uniref:Uncharacterized protein n=1 Tax=Fusarium oxysporum f. sp. melonis 26406 TaxID=1089452 RepID=W9ZE52_FUSOX|nr:hypothetical protein FOMG_16853 [Fusarium oxysporum f. sp. melonis 26406]